MDIQHIVFSFSYGGFMWRYGGPDLWAGKGRTSDDRLLITFRPVASKPPQVPSIQPPLLSSHVPHQEALKAITSHVTMATQAAGSGFPQVAAIFEVSKETLPAKKRNGILKMLVFNNVGLHKMKLSNFVIMFILANSFIFHYTYVYSIFVFNQTRLFLSC